MFSTRSAAAWSLVTCMISTLAIAKLDTWRQETAPAFAKGQRDRVVVADSGKIRLGRVLKPTSRFDAARVWDLARSATGVTYAATGDSGQVFERTKDTDWSVVFDSHDSQALAVTTLADGHLIVGTGPSGEVVDIHQGKPTVSRPHPSVQYVWDLASDSAGNVYAATGPAGGLWKRDPRGQWSQLLKSKHAHLLCVIVGPDGSVYAGSDGEGLIYRVDPQGKPSVLYDAGPAEVRCLLLAPDGALYAGTAAEAASGSGGPGRGSLPFTLSLSEATKTESRLNSATVADIPKDVTKPGRDSGTGGTATPKAVVPGENLIYRIGADGAAREIFRAKVMIYSLAWRGDRLLAGTGPEGLLYEIDPSGQESTPIAKLDHGQILALLTVGDNEVLIGAGDPAGVYSLGNEFHAEGTFTSDVHDAKLPAHFGAVTWRGETPAGTSLTLQLRTGNLAEPDATWSAWSARLTDSSTATADTPIGRFAQYRTILKTTKLDVSPEVRSVTIRYKTNNLAPEITKLDVPDLTNADGATRQTKLTVKWEATDPNGDELSYSLAVQKSGWPDWIKLNENPITELTYAWDTTTLPTGIYRLRLIASDRLANSIGLTRERVTEPFTIDHLAPVVKIERVKNVVSITIDDDLTRVTKAAHALDGGEWTPIFPDDGLFDRSHEVMTLTLPDLKPGTHVLTVRATDAAGNLGTADIVFITTNDAQ